MRHDVAALARAASRQLLWALSLLVPQVRGWHRRAQHIPDLELRVDALQGLRKRANIDGAVLFATIAKRRSRDLLVLLVAFEILADTLDCISERGADRGIANGIQLHKAMTDALDPAIPFSDYYRLHRSAGDGGHLRALVLECRSRAVSLRSFKDIARPARRATQLAAEVLPLNHEPHPERRDELLARWAGAHAQRWPQLAWFERSGAPSAWLTVLALLARSAEDHCDPQHTAAICRAYLPWVSLAGTMLDSASDINADHDDEQHSYIAHYAGTQAAVSRTAEILQVARVSLETLPDANRHKALLRCMTAMYLTKAGSQLSRHQVRQLAVAAGPLTCSIMPALRLWRAIFAKGEDHPVPPASSKLDTARRRAVILAPEHGCRIRLADHHPDGRAKLS